MTLYEIHSFIPGTRANPREMNENFNIVLEQIDTKANNDLSNLSQTGQDYIKNCSISKNIGELVYSCIPQTDSSLHLLDGSVILSNGIYQNFVSYIANLNQSYPNLFTTESDWQDSVTQYGVCGKFVYDSVNNTVRLPKVTGIVEGTTDISALGDLVEESLPNITSSGKIYSEEDKRNPVTGAIVTTTGTDNVVFSTEANNNFKTVTFTLDASRSSSTYQDNAPVQPQTIKCFVYIVIANSSKTEIQVDIDEVATDLNGKADTDLTNATDQAKILMGGMAMPSDKYINLTLGANGSTYTAPANGYFYLAKRKSNNSNPQSIIFAYGNGVDLVSSYFGVRYTETGVSNVLAGYIPCKKGQIITLVEIPTGSLLTFKFIYAQGSESEAS